MTIFIKILPNFIVILSNLVLFLPNFSFFLPTLPLILPTSPLILPKIADNFSFLHYFTKSNQKKLTTPNQIVSSLLSSSISVHNVTGIKHFLLRCNAKLLAKLLQFAFFPFGYERDDGPACAESAGAP
jgi:hypothetical protein